MEKRLSYTIVGLFVIVLSIALVAFIFWLTKYANEETKHDYYHTYFKESVSGLNIASLVKLKGVVVGQVKSIKINKKNSEEVEILLEIKKGTPIKVDTYTSIDSQGITGLKYIELIGGTKNSDRLSTATDKIATIKSKKSVLASLMDSSTTITNKFEHILDKVDGLLSDKNIKDISQIVTNLSSTTTYIDKKKENLSVVLKKVVKTLDEISDLKASIKNNLNNISKKSEDFLEHSKLFEDKILPSFVKLGEMSDKAGKASDATGLFFDNMQIELKKGQFNFSNIVENNLEILNETLLTLKDLSLKLDETIGSIEDSPSDLLYKSSKKHLGPGENNE